MSMSVSIVEKYQRSWWALVGKVTSCSVGIAAARHYIRYLALLLLPPIQCGQRVKPAVAEKSAAINRLVQLREHAAGIKIKE
jgi:hypothetical protein